VETGQSKSRLPKLRMVWFFLKPYGRFIALLFFLSLLIGVLDSASIAAIYPLVSLGTDREFGSDNFILAWIDSLADWVPFGDHFEALCVLFLCLVLASFVLKLLNAFLSAHVISRILVHTKQQIFRRLATADYQYFLDQRQGTLVYAVMEAPQGLMTIVMAVSKLLAQILFMGLVFVLLFSISWRAALVVLFAGAGYYFMTRYLGSRVSYVAGTWLARTRASENVVLNEFLSGIRQIKATCSERAWEERFTSLAERELRDNRKNIAWGEAPSHVVTMATFIGVGITALVLWMRNPESFSSGVPLFGTFAFAVVRLQPSLSTLGTVWMQLQNRLPDVEIIHSILKGPLAERKDGLRSLDRFSSELRFNRVSFAHKGRAETLSDISITFEKGKTTAIVGPSGAGKTTVVDLLLRLFDPEKGSITVDGVDLRELRLASWLEKIGFVSQDTFIYHDTVRNNITFGREGYSEEEIVQAARDADAHGFISELPQGYDTMVGERGMKLSGGQKQRIAIARAIIRKPEILVLDEATSALDNIAESAVQEAIRRVTSGRTVIVIAHRLSTIKDADKIIVLKEGRVVEEGRHEELLQKGGFYWELYRDQLNVPS